MFLIPAFTECFGSIETYRGVGGRGGEGGGGEFSTLIKEYDVKF